MILRFVAIFLALALGAETSAQSAGPGPIWVHVEELPDLAAEPDPAFVSDGVHQILLDRQFRLENDGYTRHQRTVDGVVQRLGLEDVGTIRIDFDPTDEELIVHEISRIRDGVRTELRNLEFVTIRRESDIDYGILDGRLTHYANIGDIRVGDIIDISYSHRVFPSVFADSFLTWVTETNSNGYQIESTRVLSPIDAPLSISGPAKADVTSVDGMTQHHWRYENLEEHKFDPNTQDWRTVHGFTYISNQASWADVVEGVRESYKAAALPAELLRRVEELKGTEEERVTAAFRIVQDEIRYMGIEIGAAGYIPRAPELVWSRRFGDCKDKALLLTSMLDHMGIDADVVLVNNRDGDLIGNHPPSPFAFNHAIVRVLAEDGAYFLDPTDVLQGGTGRDISTLDFVWALPLSEGSDRLVRVPRATIVDPNYEVATRYEFTEDGDYVVELTEVTTYRGESADYQRYRVNSEGLEERSIDYLDWYRDRFPGATRLAELVVEDNLDTNVLIIREHYGIPEEGFEDHWEKFWLHPYATKGELPNPPEDTLEKPMELDHFSHRHTIEISGRPDLSAPSELVQNSPFFRFTRRGERTDSGFVAIFELITLTNEIEPDEAKSYGAAYDAAYDQRDYWYQVGKERADGSNVVFAGMTANAISAWFAALITLLATLAGGVKGYRSAYQH